MATPEKSISGDAASGLQEESDVQESEVLGASSHNQVPERRSSAVGEKNKKSPSRKRLVIKPVPNVKTHWTYNMKVHTALSPKDPNYFKQLDEQRALQVRSITADNRPSHHHQPSSMEHPGRKSSDRKDEDQLAHKGASDTPEDAPGNNDEGQGAPAQGVAGGDGKYETVNVVSTITKHTSTSNSASDAADDTPGNNNEGQDAPAAVGPQALPGQRPPAQALPPATQRMVKQYHPRQQMPGYFPQPHAGQYGSQQCQMNQLQHSTPHAAQPMHQPQSPPGFAPCRGRGEPGLLVPPQPPIMPQTGGRQLTNRVTAFPDHQLAVDGRVYPGVRNIGLGIYEPVAVKIVIFSEKKKREARNLAKLTPHVNVVAIHEADIIPGDFTKSIYIVMEQCQTLSLEAYYKKRKADKLPFNTKMALEFSRQVVAGINHIHKNGIIHRDLKPSSLLFSCDGKNVKIIDFGLSKELKKGFSTMSLTSRKIGTDGFRAPETYAKDEIKRLADIFSLAITLYYIWSYGRHPFGDEPSIWSHNIEHYKNMNLGNLLVPDKETALDLLKRMLREQNRKRIRITDVLDHKYLRKGLRETLLHDMEEVWHGDMQTDDQRMRSVECVLYQRKDSPGLKIERRKSKNINFGLILNFVPHGVFMKKVLGNIGVLPDGHLAVIKDVHCVLRKKLDDDHSIKIGWIDVFRNGERANAIMIFKPKGHEDVFAVYMESPDDLIKDMRQAMPTAETNPEQPGSTATSIEKELDLSDVSSARHSTDSKDDNASNQPQRRSDQRSDTPTRRPIEIDKLEFISWWIYKPTQTSTQK